jgi:hypothetical protein
LSLSSINLPDSRVALLALKSYAVSSRVVLQCRDSLQELALSNRVRLVWVSGHCGIHGNEAADALARAGSSSSFVGPKPCVPLAPSRIKWKEREVLLKSHCASWSLETVENVAEKAQSRLDEILTEAA